MHDGTTAQILDTQEGLPDQALDGRQGQTAELPPLENLVQIAAEELKYQTQMRLVHKVAEEIDHGLGSAGVPVLPGRCRRGGRCRLFLRTGRRGDAGASLHLAATGTTAAITTLPVQTGRCILRQGPEHIDLHGRLAGVGGLVLDNLDRHHLLGGQHPTPKDLGKGPLSQQAEDLEFGNGLIVEIDDVVVVVLVLFRLGLARRPHPALVHLDVAVEDAEDVADADDEVALGIVEATVGRRHGGVGEALALARAGAAGSTGLSGRAAAPSLALCG